MDRYRDGLAGCQFRVGADHQMFGWGVFVYLVAACVAWVIIAALAESLRHASSKREEDLIRARVILASSAVCSEFQMPKCMPLPYSVTASLVSQ